MFDVLKRQKRMVGTVVRIATVIYNSFQYNPVICAYLCKTKEQWCWLEGHLLESEQWINVGWAQAEMMNPEDELKMIYARLRPFWDGSWQPAAEWNDELDSVQHTYNQLFE